MDERVQRAAQGDRAAAESLLTELLPRVRNLVRYLVRGDDGVDDIAQEALVAVLRGLRTYRGDGRLESWVDRVVARTTFAEIRRRRADIARIRSEELELAAGSNEWPSEFLARRQAVRMLDGLPLEQRHALVLHHAVGMSVTEIANLADVPGETVRSRLRLGMQKLRERMGVDG